MKKRMAAAALFAFAPYPSAQNVTYVPPPPPALVARAVYAATSEGVAHFIADTTRLGVREALRLGRIVVKVSKKYALDPRLFAAVIRHESGFQPNLVVCWPWGGCDYGLGQINDVNVERLHLDEVRLVTDDAYNLEVAAKLLASARAEAPNDPKYYSLYHDHRRNRRLKWEKLVDPYIAVAFKKEYKPWPSHAVSSSRPLIADASSRRRSFGRASCRRKAISSFSTVSRVQ